MTEFAFIMVAIFLFIVGFMLGFDFVLYVYDWYVKEDNLIGVKKRRGNK